MSGPGAAVWAIAIALFCVVTLRRRTPTWPGAPLSEIDGDRLAAHLSALLDDRARWRKVRDEDGIAVFAGRVPGCPCRAYKSVVDLPASLDAVVRLIADEMFERLGDWNAEYAGGEVLRVLEDGPDRKAWLMRVFYRTPPPLAGREYLYYLARRRLPDGRVVIVYESVDDPALGPREGYVRGALHPTVHRCTAIAPGVTRLEHVLATDLGGSIPTWAQSTLFSGSLVKATAADARAQRRLFAAAARGT
jgi:hypothetical protein